MGLLFIEYSKMWKNKNSLNTEFVIKREGGESFGKFSAGQIKNKEAFLEDGVRDVTKDCLLEITTDERYPGSGYQDSR